VIILNSDNEKRTYAKHIVGRNRYKGRIIAISLNPVTHCPHPNIHGGKPNNDSITLYVDIHVYAK
jgi:hypothetical protein